MRKRLRVQRRIRGILARLDLGKKITNAEWRVLKRNEK
jgi:hypothetical protein